VKTPGGRGGRTPRRFGAQPTRLETLDDDLGPLGPLGATVPNAVEEPPELPQKEQLAIRNTASSNVLPQANNLGLDEEDENGSPQKARHPPPIRTPSQNAPRQTQPSVSIEQAARPTFNISIGDPHKVGDLTSSHTVYQVRTKVSLLVGPLTWLGVDRTYRPPRKHTGSQSLKSRADIVTSYGYTSNYTRTTLALSYLRLQTSKL